MAETTRTRLSVWEVSFLTLLFLSPFYLGNVDTFYPFLFYALLLFLFFARTGAGILLNKNEWFAASALLPFLLLLALALFSFAFTPSFSLTRNEFIKWAVYFLIYTFALTFTSRHRDVFIYTALLSALVVTFYGLGFYIALWDPNYQPFSTFLNPNCFASFLILFIPLTIALFLKSQTFVEKQRFFCAFAIFTIALFLTSSRGAWLSLAAALLFQVWALRKHVTSFKKPLLFLGFFFTFAFLFILFTKPIVLRRSVDFFNFQHRSHLFRMLVWKGTFQMALRHPAGVGAGAFQAVYPREKLGGSTTLLAHNTYLQMGAELGVLGFAAYLLLNIMLLYQGFRVMRKDTILGSGLSASLLAHILHNAVDYPFYIPALSFYFFSFAGLCGALGEERKQIPIVLKSSFPLPVFAAVVLLIAAVVPFPSLVRIGWADYYFESGEESERENLLEQALISYKEATRLDHNNMEYPSALGRIYAKMGKHALALGAARRAVELEPENGDYLCNLGITYKNLNRFSEALKQFQIASKLRPHYTVPRKESAVIYILRKDWKGAVKELEKIIDISKNPYEGEKYLPIPPTPEHGINPDFQWAGKMLEAIRRNVK